MAWKTTVKGIHVKRWTLNDPGHTVDVTIEVDWDTLARRLGTNAAYNKSGKTRFANGAIKASVRKL